MEEEVLRSLTSVQQPRSWLPSMPPFSDAIRQNVMVIMQEEIRWVSNECISATNLAHRCFRLSLVDNSTSYSDGGVALPLMNKSNQTEGACSAIVCVHMTI